MAEALLRERLAERGRGEVVVSSAGVAALAGVPATALAVETMGERGLDLSRHRAKPVDPGLLTGADLVVCMTARHAIEVVVSEPVAEPRTFTLKELAQRLAGARPRYAGEPLADYATELAQGRAAQEWLGGGRDVDIADPIGGDAADYRATAGEIDALLAVVVPTLWPADEPPDRPEGENGGP